MLLGMGLCIFGILISICAYVFDLSDVTKHFSIYLFGGCTYIMLVALLSYYGVLGVEAMMSMRTSPEPSKVLGIYVLVVDSIIAIGIVYGLVISIIRDKKCKKCKKSI